jgi:biotin carboxylase
VLLVAPHGSYRTAPFVQAARRYHAEVLIASAGNAALVSSAAHGLHIDFADPEAALRKMIIAARATPYAAVIGTDDASTELAAQASAALGLRHNPPEAVRIARRKDLARACLARAGVAVPDHWVIDLRRPWAPQVAGLAYPSVVKPVAMSASRGVIRVDDARDLGRAIARIQALLRPLPAGDERETLLVERFIPGMEVAVEGLLSGGRLRVLAVFDKPDPLDGPYFEETYYITPSRLPQVMLDQIQGRVAAACAAYGLREGPVHAECRVNDAGVWVLEVAARTIGGLCGRLLRFGTGYTLEEMVLGHALGQTIETRREEGGAGVLMIPTPQGGILRRVEGVLAAQRVPYIDDVVIEIREGNELVPLPEGSSYLGFIFARAPTAVAAEAALRAAHACLQVVVAPLWKGRRVEPEGR